MFHSYIHLLLPANDGVSLPHQVEREKYACGVKWLHDLLYGLQFPADRVTVVATKMVNDVAR